MFELTPTEEWAGCRVKREDMNPCGFPSGKMRGVLPYLRDLKDAGVTLVVNAGATHSNSHAIVSFAAKTIGLEAATFVNSEKMHPAVQQAAVWGKARIMLQRPMHLGPLKARAKKWALEHDGFLLPWGLTCAEVMRYYSSAVQEVEPRKGAMHVVPFGAGGWTAGVWRGLMEAGRQNEVVVAVPVMPTESDERKLRIVLAEALPPKFGQGTSIYTHMPLNVVMAKADNVPTPWLSDPKYEHPAWGVALKLQEAGHDVVFWSIGRAVAGT